MDTKVKYNKPVLLKYMEDVDAVGERMHRCQDESLLMFQTCKQQYSLVQTKLEEIARRAYNRMEDAESMLRSANLEYETARRIYENTDEEDARDAAVKRMERAQRQQAEAEEEVLRTSAAYVKATEDLERLSQLWEAESGELESMAYRVEEGLSSFRYLAERGKEALAEYMSAMDKAETVLGEKTGGFVGSGGEVRTSSAGASDSISYSGASSPNGVGNAPEGQMTENRQAAAGMYMSPSGNTLGVVTMEDGTKGVSMTIGGNTEIFRGTRSGVAKAYRTALKNGDTELAERANQLFESLTKTGGLPEAGAGATLSKEEGTNSAGNITGDGKNQDASEDKKRMAATLMVNRLADRADFGNLDSRTAKDICQTVSETKEMFPDIDLRFVGSLQSRNEYIEKGLEEMYLKAYRNHYPGASDEDLMPYVRDHVSKDMLKFQPEVRTIAQSVFLKTPQTAWDDVIARYNGISINESYGGDYDHFLNVKRGDVEGKWKPVSCDTPKATVDHELGHQIAGITNAHNDEDIQELYRAFMTLDGKKRGEVLSGYAADNIDEFIAEGWSEYRNNPKCRTLALKIANRLIELYNQKSPQKVGR